MRRNNPLFFLKSKATWQSLVFNLTLYLVISCFVLSVHGQQPQSSAVPTLQESVASPQKDAQRKADDVAEMRKTITRLRAENERLRKKVASLQQLASFTSIQELLTKEEQRANNLQTQLLATTEKMAALESRMDELNEQLRPENIQGMIVAGSLRPEEVREATSRRLSSEKRRLQSQFDLLQPTRSRLQASLMGAEQTIQRLQLQLQDSLRKWWKALVGREGPDSVAMRWRALRWAGIWRILAHRFFALPGFMLLAPGEDVVTLLEKRLR